jgi:hypothetical protein
MSDVRGETAADSLLLNDKFRRSMELKAESLMLKASLQNFQL